MKKCILSALAGAMAMLIAIALMATIHMNKALRSYLPEQ